MTVALPVVNAADPACAKTAENSNVWKCVQTSTIPIRKAASPIRVTMNAFFAAFAAAFRSNQWPISRYEQSPTPSQPTYRSRKLSARTSVSMKNTKRDR